MPVLHQSSVAQSIAGSAGHATRAGHTESQPESHNYDFASTGFPKPPKFDDKLEEREYLKGRLAAAFRIFGHNGYDEGVAGHITARVSMPFQTGFVNPGSYLPGPRRATHDVGKSVRNRLLTYPPL